MVQQKLVSTDKTNKDDVIHQEELKPQLRFSEFTDDWKESNLGYLFNFFVAGDMDKELFSEIKDEEFKYPLYANALEKEGLLGYYKESKYVADSITITARGNIGHSTVRKSDFNAIGRLIILNSKKELNNDFFSEYINSNLKIYIESTGVPQLTAPSLKINKVKYPSLDEQNKIANFILAINKKIELLETKLELINNIKDSFIQNKIKEINAESKFVTVEDIFSITRGDVISKKLIKDFPDETYKYPVYSSQTLNNGIMGYYKNYDFDGDFITWTTDGANAGKTRFREGKFKCSNVCGILKSKKEYSHYSNEFIANYLDKNTYKYVSYVGNPKLMNKVMAKIKIPLLDKMTQEKYSKAISVFNKKCDLTNGQLEQMKNFKKGLLQKMFV